MSSFIVDENNRLKYSEPRVIAEIGCNHKGDLDVAKELISLAKQSGAAVAKFQKRHSKTLLSEEQYNAPHPNPWNSYGSTYGEHREFLEFNIDQHQQLKSYCDEIGITYCTSVWDVPSAQEIIQLNPEYIKVPSACNNNLELLEILRDNYKGNVHVSLGMTTSEERKNLIEVFEKTDVAKERLVLYVCTSGYPVPFEQTYLLEIQKMQNDYGQRVSEIGFSGHHLGIAIDIVAYTLGARWIERHFTKDRTWKGTDHAMSLEPSGLSKLVRDLQAAHKSLRYRDVEISEVEQEQREKLKYKKV